MKKALSVLFASLLLFTSFHSLADTYSEMTNEDLQAVMDTVRNELFLRSLKLEPDQVLYDFDGVKVYLTGKWEYQEDYGMGRYLKYEIAVINQTDVAISLSYDRTYINGWEVGHIFLGKSGTIEAGKKKKTDLVFAALDADITDTAQIDEIEFDFTVSNAETKKPIKTVPITLYPNK